jgi:hypothetical protein
MEESPTKALVSVAALFVTGIGTAFGIGWKVGDGNIRACLREADALKQVAEERQRAIDAGLCVKSRDIIRLDAARKIVTATVIAKSTVEHMMAGSNAVVIERPILPVDPETLTYFRDDEFVISKVTKIQRTAGNLRSWSQQYRMWKEREAEGREDAPKNVKSSEETINGFVAELDDLRRYLNANVLIKKP